MSTTPCCFVGDSFYRYTIQFDTIKLKRTELISAVHKLMRRAQTEELLYLADGFFEAVTRTQPSANAPLQGAITHFINRSCVVFFEEGTFAHCEAHVQTHIVACLVESRNRAANEDYPGAALALKNAFLSVHETFRGRIGSVVKAHAANQMATNTTEEARIVASMHPDQIARCSALQSVIHAASTYLPTAMPLLMHNKLSKCNELLKVVYMCAMTAKLIPSKYKTVSSYTIAKQPREPSMNLLQQIGVFDMHVLGIANVEAAATFRNAGCLVANPTPLVAFGLDYATLESNYQSFSATWHAQRQEEQRLEKASASSSSKRARLNAFAPLSDAAYSGMEAIIDPSTGTGLLGFKNPTTVATLVATDLAPFTPGDRVFFKIGEATQDFVFAKRCGEEMLQLSMSPPARTIVSAVRWDASWWKAYGERHSSSDVWVASMLKTANSRFSPNMSVSCLVQDAFDGMRLTDANPPLVAKAVASWVNALLFAKYVGIKDVSAYNAMVSPFGHVVLVDVNLAADWQIAKYNKKGLYMSHRPNAIHRRLLAEYAIANVATVASFIRRLKAVATRHPLVVCDLFEDATLVQMENGDAAAVRQALA